MKKLASRSKFLLRSFYNLAVLFYAVSKMKLTGIQKKNSHHILLKVFETFGGIFNPIISKILGLRKLKFDNSNGLLAKFSGTELDKAQLHLKKEGYVVFENVLTPDLCNSFIEMSQKIPGKNRIMDEEQGEARSMFFERNNPKSVRFDYSGSDLLSTNIVQELISDTSIIDFAQKYLGAAPILDLIAMWWHTTFSDLPDKQAAQWFHYDMDRVKWIKFFFYLTDVDSNSGPHTFVPKTHRRFGIPFKLRRKGYTRLSDLEVEEFLPSRNWKEFVGKRGTLIVEDTRGLHKGKHCKSGDRLLFQLEFTTSKFGAEIEELKISKNSLLPDLKIMMNKYPSIYTTVEITD